MCKYQNPPAEASETYRANQRLRRWPYSKDVLVFSICGKLDVSHLAPLWHMWYIGTLVSTEGAATHLRVNRWGYFGLQAQVFHFLPLHFSFPVTVIRFAGCHPPHTHTPLSFQVDYSVLGLGEGGWGVRIGLIGRYCAHFSWSCFHTCTGSLP